MNIGWREGADRDTALCDTETTTLDVNYWKDWEKQKTEMSQCIQLHKFRDLGIEIYGLKIPSQMELAYTA